MTVERTRRTPVVPAWGLAVTAMLAVQLSSALSIGLISAVGAAGTAWLRLSIGALVLLAMARRPLRGVRRRDIPVLIALGVATGLMSVAFLAAIERIPLGTAVAIEFLGPLTVAALRSHNTRALAWPALALLGVILLAEPWQGTVNVLGIGYAVLAGIGWAAYILLTQRVGDRFAGIQGLALTVPIAAATTAVIGIPQASTHVSLEIIAAAAGLALLFPVVTFMLEMSALRRMTHTAFGTLMAVEPAFAVLLGLLVLHQRPSIVQVVGITIVVLAGSGAQRQGRRADPDRATNLPTLAS
jgi:inner membrane transporter RhtA